MNIHQKLDAILKYMSKNIGEIPQRPDTIVKKANLNFDKSESYMIFRMLLDEGYVYEHKNEGYYGIKYKGIVFLDNGGYQLQNKIYKRKQLANKIADYSDIILKPLGLFTILFGGTYSLIKILEFFKII